MAQGLKLLTGERTVEERTLASRTIAHDADRPSVAPIAALTEGDRVPGAPYVVVRRLGAGGMGEVYEVEHATLGRRAALKVLHRRHAGRADLAARIRAEARVLARLRHTNVVEVFDLGTTSDERPWFVMPLLRGRDLREHLVRVGPLPASEAASLMVQALNGLSAAHAADVVHRDVKLENLFLEDDGTVRVIDFGVARVGGGPGGPSGSPWTRSPGTPRSMAPEQSAGEPVDARSDVYGVGVALYELCAGRGPFDDLGGDEHALRFAHSTRHPIPPSAFAPRALPAALDGIVLRALAKSPRDRFPTASAMAAALERVASPYEIHPGAEGAFAAACLALGLEFSRLPCARDRPL
jgi:serine/threonine protein kinase